MITPKPSRLDHVHRHFMSLMAQMNRQWRRVIDRQLEPLGLTEAAWLPLLHLARAAQPMRQKDLAASLSLDGSSVVRLLDGLETGGLVERREGEDRRAKTIHLTPLGQTRVKRVEEVVSACRDGILTRVPARELEQAFRVLEQLAEAVSSMEEERST
ncbi:MAG: MarR family transcriptional regulator [Burkholderiales bacterium]|nr:MarR family transcriptional regulator [Burkholderiales bacterium]